jgi:hypothetical protein
MADLRFEKKDVIIKHSEDDFRGAMTALRHVCKVVVLPQLGLMLMNLLLAGYRLRKRGLTPG